MEKKLGILIVDDQENFAHGLCRLIGGKFPDLVCFAVTSGDEALDILEREFIALMITDLRMPEMDGLQLLDRTLEIEPTVSVVLLTGYGSVETAVQALKAGAYDFLTKPIDQDLLFRVVEKGVERSRLLRENFRLKSLAWECELDQAIIGQSKCVQRLKETICAVAGSDYTVLILGESGVGKELVAKMVHKMSPRANKPLVSVNCPAIPSELLESELFGHVKGAFTGANRSRKGLFLAANGGSILLDEIGDISPHIQTKLLRVLQDQEVRPVGSSTAHKVNVRILASTNQDLQSKIKDNSFREDLYYRLNVLTIEVPPLRERKEDIPLLAQHFVLKTCKELNIPPKEVSPEVMAWLSTQEWPGNIRELINFVRRLVVFSGSEVIDMPVLSLLTKGNGEKSMELKPYKQAKAEVVDNFTRNYVTVLMRKAKGNVSEAARLSGLERVSLQKILKRLNINAQEFRMER
ncbi:sigma-54-dependent transcriptional regulator [Desulfovulcanus sp.]